MFAWNKQIPNKMPFLLSDPQKIIRELNDLTNVTMSADFKKYINDLIQDLFVTLQGNLRDNVNHNNGPFTTLKKQASNNLYKDITTSFDIGYTVQYKKGTGAIYITIMTQKAYASAGPATRGIASVVEYVVGDILGRAISIESAEQMGKRVRITKASIDEVLNQAPDIKAFLKSNLSSTKL